MKSSRPLTIAAMCLVIITGYFGYFSTGPTPGKEDGAAAALGSQPKAHIMQPALISQWSDHTEVLKHQFATEWGHEREPTLAAFSEWAARYVATTEADRAPLEIEGVSLARARRPVLKQLIQSDPKRALAAAAPAAVRAAFPASILQEIEERVTGKGDLAVIGRTERLYGAPVVRIASINGMDYDAFVYGRRKAQRTSTNISLHGISVDGQMAISESTLRAFETGEVIPMEKPLSSDSCLVSERPIAVGAESGDEIFWLCQGEHIAVAAEEVAAREGVFLPSAYRSTGDRSVMVMLLDFPDVPGGPVSAEVARTKLDSACAFLEENSFGDVGFTARTITPVLRLPQASTAYVENSRGIMTMLVDARAAALAAGYDPNTNDFQILAFAQIGMPWSGQGYIGGGTAWVQGDLSPGVVAHEVGHNLGLWHANLWRGATSMTDANGTHLEYGNDFDVLGRSSSFPLGHFNANFKSILGWLPRSNLHTIVQSGTYRIYAHDQNSRIAGRQYGLRIPAGFARGDETHDYWVELRQKLTRWWPQTDVGALALWGNETGSDSGSRLLDFGWQTALKQDAPLPLGQTLVDEENGIRITPVARQGTGVDAWMDVQVTLGRAEAPRISVVGRTADQVALLVSPTIVGGKVILETSTDLLNWVAVSTNAVSSSSLLLEHRPVGRLEFIQARAE